jgi:hypothetical protein
VVTAYGYGTPSYISWVFYGASYEACSFVLVTHFFFQSSLPSVVLTARVSVLSSLGRGGGEGTTDCEGQFVVELLWLSGSCFLEVHRLSTFPILHGVTIREN